MPIRAVSFDLFDTLVDLELAGAPMRESLQALHAAVAAHTDLDLEGFGARAREVDRELRGTRYVEGLEVSSEERFARILERIGVDTPGLVDELTGIHMGVLHGRAATPDHHAGVLRQVAARVRAGLCSNFTHAPTALRILEESRLAAHLDPIVISVEVGHRKPRREIFDALLRGLGVAPEETLHVGDNLQADVAGAAAVGMRTGWLTRRVPDPEAALAGYDGPPPDHVLGDVREVLGLLA